MAFTSLHALMASVSMPCLSVTAAATVATALTNPTAVNCLPEDYYKNIKIITVYPPNFYKQITSASKAHAHGWKT